MTLTSENSRRENMEMGDILRVIKNIARAVEAVIDVFQD